jgi:hypothetical protein
MAFDPVAKLSDLLTGGYHLSARLQALLGRPLDSRGQEEAFAFSQELSRVFMVSLSMLKPDGSKRTLNKMSPVIRAGDSFGICTLAKDKVIVRYALQLCAYNFPSVIMQRSCFVWFNEIILLVLWKWQPRR